MPYEIVMPQLGLTMTEGSVNAWLKQPGERVDRGEMLFTVSTDKVDMEVESTGTGFLNPVAEVGKTVPVGTVIAILSDRPGEVPTTNAHTDKPPAASEANGNSISSEAAPASRGETKYPASPRARALARSLGIEIRNVTPKSGNRIVEEDVKQYHAREQTPATQTPIPTGAPLCATRRITAERTAQSFERAPHFYLGVQVDAEKLVSLRSDLAQIAERQLGFKPTYTDFLLRALTLALHERPEVNSYWQDGSIAARASIDVGFAAQTDAGLLVPVIRNTDRLGLFAVASQRRQLAERARAGSLTLNEMQGGSATLSNLGTEGVDWFQAILNPPQSVILASGSLAKRPVVIDDRIEIRHTLTLTLSADHRVLDGVAAAKFLAVIKRTIESPLELMS
jgi:pyruvate dehydrogenase E2 component (dihydrolipoamide acetyltransferase)